MGSIIHISYLHTEAFGWTLKIQVTRMDRGKVWSLDTGELRQGGGLCLLVEAILEREVPLRLTVVALVSALCLPLAAQHGPSSEYRSIDGVGNNIANPLWGAAEVPLQRVTTNEYGDGLETPSGADRPGPRDVSNAVFEQLGPMPNSFGVSDFFWQWGQFLDHDIDLSPETDPAEHFDIGVPTGDIFFDPMSTGTQTIPLARSEYVTVAGVREQTNVLTAFIDASNVYGSDDVRAQELRTLDGSGKLKTSAGDLLPFNVNGLPNAPTGSDPSFFLAGDVRANEQVGLACMHTLFVREHNHWCDVIAAAEPGIGGDEIYERARRIVAAEMQAITYNEFLPLLLGDNVLSQYQGYAASVNPGIFNSFSTAAYRFGHTMLSPNLARRDASGAEIPAGDLSLAAAFFAPQEIIDEGIDSVLRGLAFQAAQEIDNHLVDEVRNFLFGPPGAGGFDLASLNIQRGRDHGLPSYNQVRVDFGLAPRTLFSEVTSDPDTQARLASVYGSVDEIDLWVGGLSEDPVAGALVGETLVTIFKAQFEALRDGDRFFYQVYLEPELRDLVTAQTLSTIIKRNTDIGDELQENVFLLPPLIEFVRGDCNGNSSIDIGDALRLLGDLFGAGEAVTCADSCDTNDSGSLDISDAIQVLNYLFLSGMNPAAPFPSCGEDPTGDSLNCVAPGACP